MKPALKFNSEKFKIKNKMNKRQIINKILHGHIDVNKHEDYTNYKKLITAIEEWHESEVKKLKLTSASINEVAVCDLCNGTGYICTDGSVVDCYSCNGTGKEI